MSNGSIDAAVNVELGAATDAVGYMQDDLNTEKEYYAQEPSRAKELLQKALTAQTGEGSVESYMEHPMNVLNNTAGARILRGLTGIFGNLDLAIIDIVVGVLDLLKNRSKQNGVSGGGNFPA